MAKTVETAGGSASHREESVRIRGGHWYAGNLRRHDGLDTARGRLHRAKKVLADSQDHNRVIGIIHDGHGPEAIWEISVYEIPVEAFFSLG